MVKFGGFHGLGKVARGRFIYEDPFRVIFPSKSKKYYVEY